jgi:PAS domain S-box-containing protein
VFLIGAAPLVRAFFDSAQNIVEPLQKTIPLELRYPSDLTLNTALSLAACGLGLFLLSERKSRGKTLVLTGTLGALAAGLGLIEIVGSIFDVTAIRESAISHYMPLPAAVGVSFAGTHLIASAIRRLLDDSEEFYRITPMIVTAGFVFATLGLWQVFLDEEFKHIRKLVDLETLAVKSELLNRLEITSVAIQRSGQQLEYFGTRDKKFLELDVRSHLLQLPMIRQIGLMGTDFKVSWSIPRELLGGFALDSETVTLNRKATLDDAAKTRGPSFSRAIALGGGGVGFFMPVALFKESKLMGFLYANVDSQKLFKDLPGKDEFSVVFRESKTPIFRNGNRRPVDIQLESLGHFFWHRARFEIGVSPTTAFILENRSPIANGILFGGSLVSLLLGLFLQSLAYARRNERRHREIDQRFTNRQNLALKSAQIAIWSLDIRTGAFWRSANHYELFGHRVPLAHWGVETLFDQILPVDRERIALEVEILPTGDEPSVIEFRIRREIDAEIRWLRIISRTDFDRHQRPFQVVGIVQDITRERHESAEKKTVEAEARLAYERLERVIEATGQGIWERNLSEANVQFMDVQCRRIFGFSPDENHSYEKIFSLIYPEDSAKISEAISEHIAKRTPHFVVDFRILPRLADGKTVWARVKGFVHRESGVPDRMVATVNDITDRVADRRRLETALERAQAGVEAKSAFLANISHEIRTPLNGIIGMADLIRETPLDPDQDKYVKIIQQSGATLLTLLNDILDLSKIEAGKLDFDIVEFSPETVVENQVEILFAKAAEKKLSLATFISPDLPSGLLGDPGRIGQILLNFVGNAIKFTSIGGISVRLLDLKSERLAESIRLRLEVEDTGIGLSAADRVKLFTPFTQATHSTLNRYGGTGLGLSICKRLVEAMGGQIGVESSPGQGSMFWCEFPLKIGNPVLLRDTREEISDLRNVRALVVDPDSVTREIVHQYINAWSMRNGSVGSVEEALPILRAAIDLGNPYLIVVVGCSYDPVSGLNVATEIVKVLGETAPKVVLASEFGVRIDTSAPGREYVSEFLTCPIKQFDLFESFVNSLPGARKQFRSSDRTVRVPTSRTNGFVGRILVADDVVPNQILTLKLLESLGHKATSAANGKEVLAAISLVDYDLILMDCQMPEMDGFEATRKIRTLEKYTDNHIPIIALTANAMAGDDKKCFAAGMDDYLAKPIKKEKLNEMLRKWLGKRKKRSSAEVA